MASDVTKLIDLTSSEVPVQAEMPPVLAMEILFPIRFLTPIWRPMLRMEQHKLYSMVKKKKKSKTNNGEAGIYFKNQLCNIFWAERHQVWGRVEVNLRDLERVGVTAMSYSRTGVQFRPETGTVLLYSSYMGFPNYCHGNFQLSQIWRVCRLTC